MSISRMFDVSSARREIKLIIERYNNFEVQRVEIGRLLFVVLKRHGHKQANHIIHELDLHVFDISFVCPLVEAHRIGLLRVES